MPESEAELKARLMKEFEALLDKVLAERKPAATVTLADIEKVARQAGIGVEEAVAQALVDEGAKSLPDWPKCPKCGRRMKNKGKRQRRVVTETGEIEVERDYYHCANCHEGFFPPR
jgi:tRNA(Ile2) C34 agmatinyltransferase TiaS